MQILYSIIVNVNLNTKEILRFTEKKYRVIGLCVFYFIFVCSYKIRMQILYSIIVNVNLNTKEILRFTEKKYRVIGLCVICFIFVCSYKIQMQILYSTIVNVNLNTKEILRFTEKTGSNLFSARTWLSQTTLDSPVLALSLFRNK